MAEIEATGPDREGADKPAREASSPPGTRNADGTLRTIRTRGDRAEVAELYFRQALVEVPAMMRGYAKAGPDPGKVVPPKGGMRPLRQTGGSWHGKS